MNKLFNDVVKQAFNDYNEHIVVINQDKINSFAIEQQERVLSTNLSTNEVNALHNKSIQESIQFLIALNSINYQFWDMVDSKFTRYEHHNEIGALAMFKSFENFFEFMKQHKFNVGRINRQSVYTYFGNIPDLDSRVILLQESFNPQKSIIVYHAIIKHINNYPFNVPLAKHVAQIMPLSYSDPYLKKIQLALYQINNFLNTKGFNISCDITVAADYQVPKVLQALDIISYCADLEYKINNHILLMENSIEEKAIRAATIIACEKISTTHNIPIATLDRLLWSKRILFQNKKFHLTKTRKY